MGTVQKVVPIELAEKIRHLLGNCDYADKETIELETGLKVEFVFGEADVASGVATVSLCRLRPEFYGQPPDSDLWEERAIKEATHEIGHLYGLVHCPNVKCVMHFSTSIEDVDRKKKTFCSFCKVKLRDTL